MCKYINIYICLFVCIYLRLNKIIVIVIKEYLYKFLESHCPGKGTCIIYSQQDIVARVDKTIQEKIVSAALKETVNATYVHASSFSNI